jgi:hypothetical protein
MNGERVDVGRLAEVTELHNGGHEPGDRMCAMAQKLAAHTIDGPGGCRLWVGYIQPNGYGYVNVGRHKSPAHRLALILSGVPVAAGMDVCHRCDVRNCVNPAHLYVGTRRQNMADCTARARHNKPRGARHWAAKLSDQDVVAIRRRRLAGEKVTTLAEAFGVHYATISRIARGVWRQEASHAN